MVQAPPGVISTALRIQWRRLQNRSEHWYVSTERHPP
jgi:hypothetical protein